MIHIFWPCRIQSVAVAARARAHRAGVRAGVGLGQPEAADRLAGGHPRQPLLLLLLAAPALDRVHRQRPLHRDERAQRRCRPPRAPGTPDRRRSRWRRRSRSPRRCMPSTPSLPSCGASSRWGSVASSNQSPTCGTTRSRTNARTVSRMSRSSSESRWSMPRKSSGLIVVGAAVRARHAASPSHVTVRFSIFEI